MEAILVASSQSIAPRLQFSPLTAFLYADQAEMLTFTGIISKAGDNMIEKLEMEKFPFSYCKDDGPYRIAPLPIMTSREKNGRGSVPSPIEQEAHC